MGHNLLFISFVIGVPIFLFLAFILWKWWRKSGDNIGRTLNEDDVSVLAQQDLQPPARPQRKNNRNSKTSSSSIIKVSRVPKQSKDILQS